MLTCRAVWCHSASWAARSWRLTTPALPTALTASVGTRLCTPRRALGLVRTTATGQCLSALRGCLTLVLAREHAGDALPRVSYTEAELATWTEVYEKLRGFTRKFAVREFNEVLDVLE